MYHPGYPGDANVIDPVTGAAPHVWDRALGWYFMSLVDILDVFPRTHRGWKKNLRRFQDLAKALKTAQDESGGWWLIMDEPYPSDPRNYIESSGSAMFTYGFLKGMRKGYLKKKEYKGTAEKGYKNLAEEFVTKNQNGTLNWEGTVEVGSLSSNGSFEVSFPSRSRIGNVLTRVVLCLGAHPAERHQRSRSVHVRELRAGGILVCQMYRRNYTSFPVVHPLSTINHPWFCSRHVMMRYVLPLTSWRI